MDLGSFSPIKQANEGVEVQIFHPVTRADVGISVKVAGVDSDIYRKAQREAQRRRMVQMERGGKLKLTPEELEAESLALLVSCVLAWTGVEWEGAPLACNPANVQLVFEAHPWLREQVDQAVGDRALFLGA